MSNKERFYAAACQMDMPNPVSRDEIELRVTKMLEMIDYAVIGYKPFHDVKLVVFPEFAHAAPIYDTAEKLIDRLAIPVPNEFTDRYHKKARDLGIYIQTGSFQPPAGNGRTHTAAPAVQVSIGIVLNKLLPGLDASCSYITRNQFISQFLCRLAAVLFIG